MFANLKEAFQDADYMSFRPDLDNLLGNSYPNQVPASDAAAEYARTNKNDINAVTRDLVSGQFDTGETDIASRFRPLVPKALRDRQTACQGATIDQAAEMFNPASDINCGWIYKNSTAPNFQPTTNVGFLGHNGAPIGLLGTVPTGTFYPDPANARTQQHKDLCAKVTSCSQLDNSFVAGKCAWSPEAGKAIPINSNGAPRFSTDPLIMGGVQVNKLVRTAQNCPPIVVSPSQPIFNPDGTINTTVTGTGTDGGIISDECPAGEDANTFTPISKRCLIEKLTSANCTTQGTLYAALSAATNPNDLLADISLTSAFKRYQEAASVPLMRETLKDGKITAQAALQNFQGLYTAATNPSNENTSFGYAARDLCNRSKRYDTFDFCTEISDTQPPPFSLDCMQKEFKKVGGIPNGTAYPIQADTTSTQWPNWGAYKAYVALLAQQTNSTDIRVQEVALQKLLGIARKSLLPRSNVPIVDGYELYINRWRSNDDTIFMGRMFMDASPGMPLINSSSQIPALMGASDSSMAIIANLKPPTDKNVEFSIAGGWSNILRGFLNGQSLRNGECKNLSATYKNNLYLYYGQTAGNYAQLQVKYKLCGQNTTPQLVPGEWLKLTQELKAPMISCEVNNQNVMAEFRQPDNFRGMGTYLTESTPSNYQSAPNGKKFIKITSTQNFWQINKLVNIRAWNSLTFCFRIDSGRVAVGPEGLFAYRFTQLGLGLTDNNSITAFLPDNTTFTFANTLSQWYVCYIQKESSGGYSDNKYTIAIYPFDDVVNGVSLNEPDKVVTKIYYRNVPIAKDIESNGLFQFGYDTVSQISARFSLAWFHVFDYNLTSADLQKDATDSWGRY